MFSEESTFLLMKDFKNINISNLKIGFKNIVCFLTFVIDFRPLNPKYRVKSFLWMDVQMSCLGMWIYVIDYKMSLGNIKH